MPFLNERRLGMINRAVTSGRILPFLALFTFVVTGVAAVVIELLAPNDFDSLGDAIWWSAQTVTTVGYGDVVPANGPGRAVAIVVMVFGVAAVSLVTAIVTSAVVAWEQRQRRVAEASDHPPVHEVLARIEERLERVERRLG